MLRLKIVEDLEDEASLVASDDLRIVRDRSTYERCFKPVFDRVGGSAILLVGAPAIAGIAALIRVKLGKGVFYTQERVGRDGELFTIYKFRTMQPDRRERQVDLPPPQDRRVSHKTLGDPRHTRLGQMLRRFSLDELPQLFNVVRGDMSLVGPRPEVVSVAKERGYFDHPRHQVKPGMTGPYQVSDLRLSGDLQDGLELDAEYVESVSFRTDMKYLLKTITVMLDGATGS